MAYGYDGSVRFKADLNHNPFDRGLSAMEGKVKSFNNTLKKLAGVVAVAFGTAAIVNFGKESIKLASDIQEVQNVIDVTFGQGAAQIEEFAKSAAEAFGLSELSAKQYAGTMGAMLKSSGLATGAAQEMSTTLAGLAGDLASFYNLDTDTAFEKIRSGISGETEPLKQLGINMSVANLEAYALAQGITKSYNAMSQSEQVLLRYNYLLGVTTDAQGDFARTSGSFANQIRILQLNFDQLRIAVGNALIPIAQAVLPGINAIISALTKLATVFAQVTALLFGKSAEVKATSGIASSAGAAAGATDRLAEATKGAGDAAKQTAKDMKGVLAGFDELNILADNAAGSVGGAGGGGSGGGGIDTAIPEIPSFESEIEDTNQLAEAIGSLGELFIKTLDDMLAAMPAFKQALLDFAANFNDFNQKLYDAFTFPGVLDRVKLLGEELADAFNGLVNAIDWELWGRTLGAGLNLGLNFLTSFIYGFDWINLGNKLAEFINGLVYEIDWYEFGRLLWAEFKIALETFAGFILGLDMPALAEAASKIVKGFFDEMKNTIDKIEWGEIGKQIAEFLNNIDWIGVITSIAGALESMVDAAIEFIGGFIEEADPDTLLIAAAFLGTKLLGGLIGKVVSPIAKKVASNLVEKIAESITSSGISSLLSSVGSAISKIAVPLAGIGSIIAGVVIAATSFFSMWNEGFSLAKEAVMLVGIALTAVGAVLLGVPATVAAIVAGIVAVVATAAVLIHEHWDEIKEFAVGAFESIKEAWSNAGEWFSENVIQPVAEFFSGLWEDITTLASEAWQAVQDAWAAAATWFNETFIEPVKTLFSTLWENVKSFTSLAWEYVKTTWNVAASWFTVTVIDPIKKFFSDLWESIKQLAANTLEAVKTAWSAAAEWFRSTVAEPIAKFFSEAWDKIKTSASEAWTNIKTGIQNFWSELKSWWSSNVSKYFTAEYWKDLGKRMVEGLLDGLRNIFSGLTSWASDVWNSVTSAFSVQKAKSSISSGMNYAPRMVSAEYTAYSARNLPRLANGAVIPPNQQFAAILGDQRSGKNIEAPLATIEQALQNVMNRNMNSGYAGEMTIILQVNETELGRVVYRLNNKETQRVGVRLTEVRT